VTILGHAQEIGTPTPSTGAGRPAGHRATGRTTTSRRCRTGQVAGMTTWAPDASA